LKKSFNEITTLFHGLLKPDERPTKSLFFIDSVKVGCDSLAARRAESTRECIYFLFPDLGKIAQALIHSAQQFYK